MAARGAGAAEAATVRLHVSREKDKEIALGRCRMGRYEGRSAGRLRASSQGVEGWILPPAGGAMTPPSKTRTPFRPPLVSPAIGAAHVHRTVHFSPSFLRSRYA
jgi:hypothetical protein